MDYTLYSGPSGPYWSWHWLHSFWDSVALIHCSLYPPLRIRYSITRPFNPFMLSTATPLQRLLWSKDLLLLNNSTRWRTDNSRSGSPITLTQYHHHHPSLQLTLTILVFSHLADFFIQLWTTDTCCEICPPWHVTSPPFWNWLACNFTPV